MKVNKIILIVLFGSILLSACKSDDPTIDDYFLNYQISEISVKSDIIVGAYYYNLGTNFNANIFTRLTEATDNTNGKVGPYLLPQLATSDGMYKMAVNKEETVPVIQQHIDWANLAGINYLVMPAFREDPNRLYPNNVLSQDTAFVNFVTGKVDTVSTINWGGLKYVASMDMSGICSDLTQNKLLETVGNTTIQDVLISREQRLYKFFKRVAHYFKDEKYFHLNGRPVVVLIYPERLYTAKSDTIYNNIRDTVKAFCGKDIYIIARQTAWTPPARFHYFFLKGKVDAVSMDNMCNVGASYYDRIYWLPQLINENFKYNKEYISKNFGIDFVPSVSPSFTNYVTYGNYYTPELQKSTTSFSKYCNVAKMNLGTANMVLLESFNNWQWDSAIEPANPTYGNGYGTTYLDILKKQFKKD